MTEQSFQGYPDRAEVTPVPNLFFSELLAEIDDIAELKVTLSMFWLLSRRKGYPRMITVSELSSEPVLRSALGADEFQQVLDHALKKAVERGTLLVVEIETQCGKEKAYLINSEAEKRTLARIERGEISMPELNLRPVGKRGPARTADIFTLYEQNIGLITPIIAEELKEAEGLYPADWIEEAFKEAATMNKRNWKYIARILERWTSEGRSDGESGEYSKKQKDAGRYTKGRYGHLVER